MLIFTLIPHTSWRPSSEKRSPSQCTSIDSRQKLKDDNFTNDAATIRIFIKGLKNAHSLAIHIYEKGLQTLSNAISKVKKLNAVQLTATITPPSMVNMMSNDEDHCFQCQEHGHIARNCPNIRCFECDEYCHIVMDCPHGIPPLGTLAKHSHPNCTKATMPGQAPDTAVRTGIGKVIPGHSHISTDTTAQVIMIHTEIIPDHNIGIIATTPGVAHDAQVPHTGVTATDVAMMHRIDHTTDHTCTEAHHHTTPEHSHPSYKSAK